MRPGLEKIELSFARTTSEKMPATLEQKLTIVIEADRAVGSIHLFLNDQIPLL
jgi:hypothetical protein